MYDRDKLSEHSKERNYMVKRPFLLMSSIWVAFVVALMIILYIERAPMDLGHHADPGETSFAYFGWILISVLGATIFSCIAYCFLLYEIGSDQTAERFIIIDDDDRVQTCYLKGTMVWLKVANRWEKLGWQSKPWIGPSAKVTMQLRPITANPKVRDLKYSVTFNANGNLERIQEQLKTIRDHPGGPFGSVNEFLEWVLYEFQEKNSIALSEFSNPADARQRGKFLTFTYNCLKPMLENTGINMSNAEFSLN